MRKSIYFFLYFLLFAQGALQADLDNKKMPILVSISPQKFIAEAIGGDTITVTVIVPPAASPHFYEPTPRQTIELKDAKAWFRMGEGFETRLVSLLKRKVLIVDQREGIDLIPFSCGCHANHDSSDTHTWLSPRLLKMQATQIARTLIELNGKNKQLYERNLQSLIQRLDDLDQSIRASLEQKQNRFVLVSHPAFGYYCRDYGLTQLSIETEGKEPTPKYLTDLMLKSRALKISYVYLQKQYNTKGGERLAKALKAEVIYLDPYAENVIENLKIITEAFRLE